MNQNKSFEEVKGKLNIQLKADLAMLIYYDVLGLILFVYEDGS
jgi:hypothetical protein